jgi:glycosyltransferase involved in cell wall biosynthesis
VSVSKKYKILVAIPCRNELTYIEPCILSIIQNNLSVDDLFIAVVDGMSDDGTRDVVKRLADQFPCVHLIDNPDKITPVAMNLGINAADSEYVMIMGAHSTIDSDYIKVCIDFLTEEVELAGVGGTIQNSFYDKKSEWIGFAMSHRFGVGNAHFRTGGKEGYVDTIGTPVYKRDVLEKVGFFDENLIRNQDDELNFRLIKAGYRLKLTGRVKFYYVVRASWNKMYKQYRQYGYWKVYVNRKHKTITTLRQLVPAFFVGFLFLFPALILVSFCFLFVYFGILALWLFLAIFVSGSLKKCRAIVAAVLTFFLLHTGYGIGYWEGILNFLLLGRSPAISKRKLSR